MTSASMKDVAARAGVSIGTVSNVLNHPSAVRPVTRSKVEAVFAELGFVPNASARQLAAGQSRTIAYLVLDATNPFFTDVARGVEEVARAEGLALFVCDSNLDSEREDEYLDQLTQMRVRGVLITAVDYTNPRLRRLRDAGVPVVLVDRPPDGTTEWCTIGVQDVDGGEIAVNHLIEAGHGHIAFVGGPATIPQVQDRHTGALRAMTASGLGAEALTWLRTDSLNVAEGRRAGERLLGLPKHTRPTGIFCANDLLALGLLQHLVQQGQSVPDDFAIVGYDDIEFAAAAAVPLTSVAQPRLQLGRTAALLLLAESTEGASHKHQNVVLPVELLARASSAVRNPAVARTPA